MRKVNFWLLSVLVYALTAQAGFPVIDSDNPEGKRMLKLQRTNTRYLEDVYSYDVTHYETHWDITDTTNQIIRGNVIMTATAKPSGSKSTLAVIILDLFDNMTLDSLLLTDPTHTKFKINLANSVSRSNNRVTVQIPTALSFNQQFKLNTYYHGTPTQTGFKGFEFGTRSNGKAIISSLSEPENANTWWPCKDLPKDKALADIYIKTWPFHTAVSNGLLIETLTENSKKVFHWQEKYPISTYLISVAAANYKPIHYTYTGLNGVKTMPIDCYAYPEDLAAATEDFNKTADMIHSFALRYGEYPFINEKYGMAMFPWGGAMEHQTLTSYGDGLVTGSHYYDDIVAHELGHQWLGDLVTCDTWKDLWLQEGGASYMEALWNEYKTPGSDAAYLSVLSKQRGTYFNEDANSRFPIYNVPVNYLWGSTIYKKGSWLYHMLRFVLGDEKFFAGMQSYLTDSRYAYGSATTENFISHMDSTSGVSLAKFKQQWIYQAGYPAYKYAKKIEGNQLRVQVTQTQNLTNNTPIFSMPILVRVQFTDNKDTILVLKDSTAYQTFDFSFNKPLKTTVFDFNYKDKVLSTKSEITFNSIKTEYVANLIELEQNYPNPFNPTTTINYQLPVEAQVMLKVYDVTGREVAELVNQKQVAGKYSCKFDGSQFASGLYYFVLQTPDASQTKKMVMCK